MLLLLLFCRLKVKTIKIQITIIVNKIIIKEWLFIYIVVVVSMIVNFKND